MNAEIPADYLAHCKWVGVPFAGGFCEVPYFVNAQTVAVNDRHRHLMNLAMVVANPGLRAYLKGRLDGVPFHPDVLAEAQRKCSAWQWSGTTEPQPEAAYYYFLCCWMSRQGAIGTIKEFEQNIACRYTVSGGASHVRYTNAIDSLDDWGSVMQTCEFNTLDAFVFLKRIRDEKGVGIYVDSPWPDASQEYQHDFRPEDYERLRDLLLTFKTASVCVRYGDHELIRELYSADDWDIVEYAGRKQSRSEQKELMLLRNIPKEQAA